jgi:hypothetical protein
VRTGKIKEDKGMHYCLPGSYKRVNVNWEKKCHCSVINYNLKGSRNFKDPQTNGVIWGKASGLNFN